MKYELATVALVFGLLTGGYWLGKDLTKKPAPVSLANCGAIQSTFETLPDGSKIERRKCLDGEA